MKRILLTILLTMSAGTLFAGQYEDLLKKAESTQSLDERMQLWQEAAKIAPNEQAKLELNQLGFDMAKRLKKAAFLQEFAKAIAASPIASDERKAAAVFENLMAQPRPSIMNPGVPAEQWGAYLSMPGKTPEQEFTALNQLANCYHYQNHWYKEIEVLKKILEHPKCSEFNTQDTLINLSNVYLSMNRMNEAMDCLKTMLQMKTLAPTRRAQAHLLLGDILLKGHGWYYVPNAEQYKELKACYIKAMNVKKGRAENQAVMRLVAAAYKLKKYEEVINLSAMYLNRKGIDQLTWTTVKNAEGLSLQALERHKEAIEVFEQLYKYQYKLPDTCMSLGLSYYRNGDYAMALGMYDEALVELGAADDARPAQCKYWIRRLKWFNGNKKMLDDVYAAHIKRLNEEARAAGKTGMKEIKKSSSLRPFDDGKPKKKKKPKSLEEINKEKETDLLEEGLF